MPQGIVHLPCFFPALLGVFPPYWKGADHHSSLPVGNSNVAFPLHCNMLLKAIKSKEYSAELPATNNDLKFSRLLCFYAHIFLEPVRSTKYFKQDFYLWRNCEIDVPFKTGSIIVLILEHNSPRGPCAHFVYMLWRLIEPSCEDFILLEDPKGA